MRGRLRGARVPHHAREVLGRRWPLVRARWALPAPGGYFSPHEFFPALAGRTSAVEYLFKRRRRGGCLATAPYKPLPSPRLAFQPRSPPPKKEGEGASIPGKVPRWDKPPLQPLPPPWAGGGPAACSRYSSPIPLTSPQGGTPPTQCRGAVGRGGSPQSSLGGRGGTQQNSSERRSRHSGRARTACKKLDGGLIW